MIEMTPMPCGLEDDRIRFDPEEPESDDPRTDMEKRLEWLCEEWKECQVDDHYDSWRDMKMAMHGAWQALNHCRDRHEDRVALETLGLLAFQYSMDCIDEGKFND